MSEIRKLIGRTVNAIRTAIVKGVDDSKKVQELQTTALEDEDDDAVPHYQPLGVSFRPAAGSEALVVSVGSDVSNRIALAVQSRGKRPTDAAEGAGGLYFLVQGTWAIYVGEDGKLYLGDKAPTEPAVLGDALKSWLEQMTVSTPFGPSGTPLNAAQLPTVLSQVVKVK